MADTTPSQDPLRLAEALERMRPEFCGNQATLLEASALIRAQHAALAAPQPAHALGDGWLSPEDMAALERFSECAEDSEAGGHDVPKERMKRLSALGVVQALGFGRHQITAFGSFVLGSSFARRPLETTDECNARLSREHRAKLGLPAPPLSPNASKEGGNG